MTYDQATDDVLEADGSKVAPSHVSALLNDEHRADSTPWPDVRHDTSGKRGGDRFVEGFKALGLGGPSFTSVNPETPSLPSQTFRQPGTSIDRDGLAGSPSEMIADRPGVEQMPTPESDPGELRALKAHRDSVSGQHTEGAQVPGQPPHHDVTRYDVSDPAQQDTLREPRSVAAATPNALPPAAAVRPAMRVLEADAIRRASS